MSVATAKRSDVHRPSVIQPEDYEFVGVEYQKTDDIGELMMLAEEKRRIWAHMERTGGTYSRHRHGGNCHVCGAHCIYTVLFYHPATNSYIRTGFDCAEKMDMGDPVLFRKFRAAIHDARALKAGKNKAAAVLGDAGLCRAWELYSMEESELVACGAVMDRGPDWKYGQYQNTDEYSTLRDIVGKLVRYGSISEGQEKYLAKLVDRIDNRKKIEAERAAEKAAAADCPSGRVEVSGEVLKVEYRENAYGGGLKMTVKAAAGFLVWGSVPSALSLVEVTRSEGGDTWTEQRGLERGDRVEFTATLQPSDRDAKFGFFKRPSKARVVK